MNVFFETEHLFVRELEPDDAVHLYEIHAEEKVKKWFPNESYADINEAKEAIHFFRNCVEENRLPFVLAVQLKETGELIGDTGVSEVVGQKDAFFFPILVNHENESWSELKDKAFSLFVSDSYSGAYQNELLRRFESNLGAI